MATTFTERFVAIAEAMDAFGPDATSLWDDEDGFYYDELHVNGDHVPLRVRSSSSMLLVASNFPRGRRARSSRPSAALGRRAQ